MSLSESPQHLTSSAADLHAHASGIAMYLNFSGFAPTSQPQVTVFVSLNVWLGRSPSPTPPKDICLAHLQLAGVQQVSTC